LTASVTPAGTITASTLVGACPHDQFVAVAQSALTAAWQASSGAAFNGWLVPTSPKLRITISPRHIHAFIGRLLSY
jgi:hypothetical protein